MAAVVGAILSGPVKSAVEAWPPGRRQPVLPKRPKKWFTKVGQIVYQSGKKTLPSAVNGLPNYRDPFTKPATIDEYPPRSLPTAHCCLLTAVYRLPSTVYCLLIAIWI
jgi:hypothetical protein